MCSRCRHVKENVWVSGLPRADSVFHACQRDAGIAFPGRDVKMTVVSLCTDSGVRGGVEGRRRSTDKSSGQPLRRECYPSLDSSRCPCRLPGWLLASPVGLHPPRPCQEGQLPREGCCGCCGCCRCALTRPTKCGLQAGNADSEDTRKTT